MADQDLPAPGSNRGVPPLSPRLFEKWRAESKVQIFHYVPYSFHEVSGKAIGAIQVGYEPFPAFFSLRNDGT
jgi:hypothetical protein